MDSQKKILGSRLATMRHASGLSQRALASRVSIKGPSLAAFETGDAWPSVQTLAALARVLGTSMDYLCGLTDVPHPYPSSTGGDD